MFQSQAQVIALAQTQAAAAAAAFFQSQAPQLTQPATLQNPGGHHLPLSPALVFLPGSPLMVSLPNFIILVMDTILTPLPSLASSLQVRLIMAPSLTLLTAQLSRIAQILTVIAPQASAALQVAAAAHLIAHQAAAPAALLTLLKVLTPLMMMILIIKLLLRPIITLTPNMDPEFLNNRSMEPVLGKEPYLVVNMSQFIEELLPNKLNTPSIMEIMMFPKFTKITERSI
mmetsp:Transcript_27857/g.24497  ORF Transcript_27857/g.24497 Transcript_27857/m.24497 type:complete len:229 (+) Transcript_27857:301-987(+)